MLRGRTFCRRPASRSISMKLILIPTMPAKNVACSAASVAPPRPWNFTCADAGPATSRPPVTNTALLRNDFMLLMERGFPALVVVPEGRYEPSEHLGRSLEEHLGARLVDPADLRAQLIDQILHLVAQSGGAGLRGCAFSSVRVHGVPPLPCS